MKLTVHIGATKTGTSSIQRYIHEHRAALFEQGFFIPETLGEQAHLKATMAALQFGKSPDLARLFPIEDESSHKAFKETVARGFEEEIGDLPSSSHVIISDEHLHSRLTAPEGIVRFRDLFCSHFDNPQILLYVRPQLDHVVSLYSSVLRAGNPMSLDQFIASRTRPNQKPYFDVKNIITRWAQSFGEENITVRPYKAIASGAGAVGDFCHVLGIDPIPEDMGTQRKDNASINADGQKLLQIVNRHGKDAELRRKITAWAEEHCSGPSQTPDPVAAHAFQNQFTASNEWVVEKYFDGHSEYLEPKWLGPSTR